MTKALLLILFSILLAVWVPSFAQVPGTSGRSYPPEGGRGRVVSQLTENKSNTSLPLRQKEEDCIGEAFLHSYHPQSGDTYMSEMVRTGADDMILGGYAAQENNQGNIDAALVKIDRTGTLLWEKLFKAPGDQRINNLILLRDGNILASGQDWFGGRVSLFLMKVDVQGNVLWKRTYEYTFGASFALRQMREDKDGSFIGAASYNEGGSFNERMLFLKFDANGGLLISKSYQPPGVMNVTASYDLVLKDGYTYLTGYYHDFNHYKGALLKIDNQTGLLDWYKQYDFNGQAAIFSQVFLLDDQSLCLIGNTDINVNDTSIIVVTDLSGNVRDAKYVHYRGDRDNGRAAMDRSGNLIWFSRRPGANSNADLTVMKVHPFTDVIWARAFPFATNALFNTGVAFATDSSLLFCGNSARANNAVQFFAGRITRDGEMTCSPGLLPVVYNPGRSSAVEVFHTPADRGFTEIQRTWTLSNAAALERDVVCSYQKSCTQFALAASSTTCVNEILEVGIQTNCTDVPQFEFDPAFFQLVSQTETLARFKILKSGISLLKGTVTGGCKPLGDSILITVHPGVEAVDLGADGVLCPGNTRTLQVPGNYPAYIWQDGSTNPKFTVHAPGTYHVQVTDACGNSARDTIIIREAAPFSFSLGADRQICRNDSLILNAPDGFQNYVWSPNYRISSLSGQTVTVFPTVDTSYSVQAERAPGCTVWDTIHITVLPLPAVQLGPDKNICTGGSVLFDAGPGYTHYSWSNGESGQQLRADAVGSYSVTVTGQNGCTARDTVQVLQVLRNPVVQLDARGTLCANSSRVLDAGNFTTYLWNTGSQNRTIEVRDTGTYSVSVTDANGCSGTGATRIQTILPAPTSFLPADTVICSYSKYRITPDKSFNQYLWSNRSATPSLTVSEPGTYWLEVMDRNGCSGRDSIQVGVTNCMTGIYFPDAFTPNNDGKNDHFSPLLFSTARKYVFVVYNRWGEVVFRTSDPARGWDGKVKGLALETGVYAWVCTYQLEGGPEKIEKGTVMLVR